MQSIFLHYQSNVFYEVDKLYSQAQIMAIVVAITITIITTITTTNELHTDFFYVSDNSSATHANSKFISEFVSTVSAFACYLVFAEHRLNKKKKSCLVVNNQQPLVRTGVIFCLRFFFFFIIISHFDSICLTVGWFVAATKLINVCMWILCYTCIHSNRKSLYADTVFFLLLLQFLLLLSTKHWISEICTKQLRKRI